MLVSERFKRRLPDYRFSGRGKKCDESLCISPAHLTDGLAITAVAKEANSERCASESSLIFSSIFIGIFGFFTPDGVCSQFFKTVEANSGFAGDRREVDKFLALVLQHHRFLSEWK
jgi:hypothetical protein